MKLIYSSKKKYLLILFISALIFSACGSEAESTQQQRNETVESVSVDEESVLPNQPEPETLTDPVDTGESVLMTPSETEIPAPTTTGSDIEYSLGYNLGGADLKSTDPSTVALASGEIQLVEFFAYW